MSDQNIKLLLLRYLQLYFWACTPFIVPILGDALMPAAPHRPGQNPFHFLLHGKHEAPEEATNLADTQWHTSPRPLLKAVRLLRVEPRDIFFDSGAWGKLAVRSTVKSA